MNLPWVILSYSLRLSSRVHRFLKDLDRIRVGTERTLQVSGLISVHFEPEFVAMLVLSW